MKIIHFGIHSNENKNSGDTLLFHETRKLFDTFFSSEIEWKLINLWQPVDEAMVREINDSIDLILIGGGGLFLKDQKGAEKSQSGWQWNCTTEVLSLIEKPIVIFGVGYNRFRGQEDFDPVFTENINVLAEKAVFIGLRNNGSIRAIKKYIHPENHHKIHLQFCPTTILAEIPNIERKTTEVRKVAYNLAYDRPHFRFGNQEKELLSDMGDFLVEIVEKGFQLDICLHKHIDAEILKYLPDELNYQLVNLTESAHQEIIDYYNSIDMAVGLRGHAQLIPFGLGKKILSIISHNKMDFLLEDLQHPEWGVDVLHEGFRKNLSTCFDHIVSAANIDSQLDKGRAMILDKTKANFEYLKQNVNA